MTFNTNLGDVSSLTVDIKPMTGTAPKTTTSESVQGVEPSFASLDSYNSLPLGSATLTDLSDLSMIVSGLKQGLAYYFRVRASNYIGQGMDVLSFISLRQFYHGASALLNVYLIHPHYLQAPRQLPAFLTSSRCLNQAGPPRT